MRWRSASEMPWAQAASGARASAAAASRRYRFGEWRRTSVLQQVSGGWFRAGKRSGPRGAAIVLRVSRSGRGWPDAATAEAPVWRFGAGFREPRGRSDREARRAQRPVEVGRGPAHGRCRARTCQASSLDLPDRPGREACRTDTAVHVQMMGRVVRRLVMQRPVVVVVVIQCVQMQCRMLVFHRIRGDGHRAEHGKRLPGDGKQQDKGAQSDRHVAGFYRSHVPTGLAGAGSTPGGLRRPLPATPCQPGREREVTKW